MDARLKSTHTSSSVVIETRDDVTTDEVLHVALDREAVVIGKIDVRPVSDNSGILKLHWQLVIHSVLLDVHVVLLSDALRHNQTIAVDPYQSVSGEDSDGIRGSRDGEVAVLEVTCHQVQALGFLEAGEAEVALVESIEVMASKYHGRRVWRVEKRKIANISDLF